VIRVNGADKAALKFVGGLVGTAALAGMADYITCRIRNQWHIQRGQIDKCYLPAVQTGVAAALFARIFGPVPLPLQIIDYLFQNRDLLQNPCQVLFCDPDSGQTYYLRPLRQAFRTDCQSS
jgi:hypothetical protein